MKRFTLGKLFSASTGRASSDHSLCLARSPLRDVRSTGDKHKHPSKTSSVGNNTNQVTCHRS